MPRCKHCKVNFVSRNSNRFFCYKNECIDAYYNWLKKNALKQAKRRKIEFKKENETIPELTKRAQRNFNKFIRQRDANSNCISCEIELSSKFDAGHFFDAKNHSNLRFDERNVHGQCVKCNKHLHGNLINYALSLEKKFGKVWLTNLIEDSKVKKKFTKQELREIINKYKDKFV